MQAVASACAANAAACDSSRVIADEDVGKPGKEGGYAVHWQWMRDALEEAKKDKPQQRVALVGEVGGRLQQMMQQTAVATSGDFSKARAQADAVLARSEFRAASGPTWWDRVTARFWNWVGELINGIGRIGVAAPWLGTLLVWMFFLGAAAGLMFFALRAFSRQTLRVALGEGATQLTAWDRESGEWAQLAESRAAAGDWREAVHGLYWAAIVHLESRRAWRHNPSRTPREYVRLLKPGSKQQGALRGLTQIFERVWYGFGKTDGEEYGRARSMYDGLSDRSSQEPAVAADDATKGGA